MAAALERVRSDAADSTVNLVPAFVEAAAAYATVGEVMSTLGDVFGIWTEHARV